MEQPDLVEYSKPVYMSWSAKMTVSFRPQNGGSRR